MPLRRIWGGETWLHPFITSALYTKIKYNFPLLVTDDLCIITQETMG